MPGFADFVGVVEITRLDTSEFIYYLDELYGNELLLYGYNSTRALIGCWAGIIFL